jgi:hypothetical protein
MGERIMRRLVTAALVAVDRRLERVLAVPRTGSLESGVRELEPFARVTVGPAGGVTRRLFPPRIVAGMVDYAVAAAIDRMRKRRLMVRNVLQLEQELEERIAALEDIERIITAAERVHVQGQREQVRWLLNQLRRQE